MYWTGDTPWLAAGTGAASFLAGYRHSRPKSLKKYYDYVDTLQREQPYGHLDSETERVETIAMVRLRTTDGLLLSQLKLPPEKVNQFVNSVR